mmetsp:Transcript_60735/g.108356  ORF Transcript_60735/g.108356 Transcript_60735/m.108356 type:complete len:503 (-) Transcript_60735:1067-2575(-)
MNGCNPKRADSKKYCENCQVISTVQWRHGDDKTLCNKCGLHFNRYHRHRPIDHTEDGTVRKLTSVRRKHPKIQAPFNEEMLEELYYKSLADANPHLQQFPQILSLMSLDATPQHVVEDLTKPTAISTSGTSETQGHLDELHGQLYHLSESQKASPVAYQIETHLQKAKELLQQLEANCSQRGVPSDPGQLQQGRPHRSPPSLTVRQRQLAIQLHHAPSRQLSEAEWYRRAALASPLPLSAYVPYDPNLQQVLHKEGYAMGLQAHQAGAGPVPLQQSAQAYLQPPGVQSSPWFATCPMAGNQVPPHLQDLSKMQELQATAEQSLTQKNRQLFEGLQRETLRPQPTAKAEGSVPSMRPHPNPSVDGGATTETRSIVSAQELAVHQLFGASEAVVQGPTANPAPDGKTQSDFRISVAAAPYPLDACYSAPCSPASSLGPDFNLLTPRDRGDSFPSLLPMMDFCCPEDSPWTSDTCMILDPDRSSLGDIGMSDAFTSDLSLFMAET